MGRKVTLGSWIRSHLIGRGSIWFILIAGLSASCQSDREGSGKGGEIPEGVVVLVEDETISLGAFEAELLRRAGSAKGADGEDGEKRKVLGQMIRTKALVAKARAEGFMDRPEIADQIDALVAMRYREAHFEESAETALTPAEIEDYYQRNREDYLLPDAVRAGVIWIKVGRSATAEKRAQHRRRAERIHGEAQAATDGAFRNLVSRHSDHQASRYTGGDTGWLRLGDRRSGMLSIWESAARELEEPGDVAPLIECEDGFSVVRLSGHRVSEVRPINEVREEIGYRLSQAKEQDRQEAFFTELEKGLRIRVNEELLDSVPLPEARGLTHAPPSLPAD